MSLKEKPIIKLYEYKTGTFSLIAMIDDYQECSFNHNRFQAGQFIIQINYNISNASLFQRGLFVQFGGGVYDFGEILNIQDTIGEDGKGSQIRTITGYDARYLFKRRVIRNLNNADSWQMTAKGELVMRNLIKDQCGAGAEAKRQLPIVNVIPTVENAIGKEYSCKESFSNLYEVLQTIATQSEIGWRIKFEGGILTLEFYAGNDLKDVVKFDTDFESLANGTFTDSSESFSNAVFVAGKGTGTDRDIYEGENEIGGSSPAGLDRFESYDNQSQMTTEEQYEAEALSMLNQYGQTLTVSGKGLVQCPYIFREQYDVGDIITIHFSGKSAVVQILAVTQHWAFGSYELEFQFGKPINDLSSQLQLILRQIQKASSKTNACTSVKWYTIPTDTEQEAGDVIYDTLGFTGISSSDSFTIYLDNEGTGAKVYNLYVKNLTGSLTLTTGFDDAEDLIISGGTYTGSILVDTLGNISLQSSTVAVNSGAIPSGTANTITVGGQTYTLGGGGSGSGVPLGSITAYYGTTDPADKNWLICDGRDTTGTEIELETYYPSLYEFLGGSNILPDLRECVPVGAGENSTFTIGNHDIYTLGQFKDDQLQDHTHLPNGLTGGRIHNGRAGGSAQCEDGIREKNTGLIAEGRTGTTTHGKQVGVNWIIKATSSSDTYTPPSQEILQIEQYFDNGISTVKTTLENKIKDSNSYSTSETLTGGTWIDGKPIYRKVYSGTMSSGTSLTLQSGVFTALNIENIIDIKAIARNGSRVDSAYYYSNSDRLKCWVNTSGNLLLDRGSSYPSTPMAYFVIIEYTKN